jgi:hypothetical protein
MRQRTNCGFVISTRLNATLCAVACEARLGASEKSHPRTCAKFSQSSVCRLLFVKVALDFAN